MSTEAASSATEAADAVPPRRVVLSVDDSLTIRKLIENALRPAGYEVLLAASGEEGLTVIRERQPDLVLLDYVLPDLRGVEFCQRLLADERTRDVPVLLISGHGSAIQELSHDCPNVVDYLTKPFASNVLQAVVTSAFEKHAARTQARGEAAANAADAADASSAPAPAPASVLTPTPAPAPPVADPVVAVDELRRRVFERLVARLHAQLPSIPAWETARGGNEPLSYYLSRLLPLDLVDELAGELARAAELPRAVALAGRDAADAAATMRGSTRFVPERHILSHLYAESATGELRLSFGEETVTVWFDAGTIVSISSNHPRFYCAGSVYPFLQVPHAVVSTAMLAQRDTSVPFFVTAASRGVQPDGVDVHRVLRESGHRCMARVYVATTECRFAFRPLTPEELPDFARAGSPYRVEFSLPQLLLESYRTVNDWQHVQQVVPRLELYVGRTAYDSAYLAGFELDELETALLERMDFRHTVAQLQEILDRPLFEVCRAIYCLARLDLCYVSDLPMAEEGQEETSTPESGSQGGPESPADPTSSTHVETHHSEAATAVAA